MSASNKVRKYYRPTTPEEIAVNKFLADSFIEKAAAKLPGVEYNTSDGGLRRIVFVKFSAFDLYRDFAEAEYREEIFTDGEWRMLGMLKTQIDGTEFYYSDPLDQNTFGKIEPEPYNLDDQGNQTTLKPGLDSEVDFFSDTLLKNIHGLPGIGMNMFIYQGIEALINKISK